MATQKNTIFVEKNGSIVIQDITNGNTTIHTDNPELVIKELQSLTEAQIDSLLQIVETQKGKVFELFKIFIQGFATEKNIVKGSISNVKNVKIGDEFHFYYSQKAKISKELTITIPKIHQDDIIGRESELDELFRLLHREKRVVLVNGLGGIGKTTIAQAYISKYYESYAHIAWITQSSDTIANDFINNIGLIKNLNIDLNIIDPKKVFEEIIRSLKKIEEKPNLFVIDNAEQTLSQYIDVLPNQPSWHLLVTSREEIANFFLKQLAFLNEEQSILLFKKHYSHKKLNENDIKELVAIVEYHTLTIEILAKTAQVQRYDVALLKNAIEQNLRANIQIPHSKPFGKVEKIGTYLSTVFSLSKLNKNEIWLLKQFTCLPPDYHTYDILKELLFEKDLNESFFAETLASLAQKGWLLQDTFKDTYKMHRVISEVVKRERTINIIDIEKLLQALIYKLELDQTIDNPIDKVFWIPFAEVLLDNLKSDNSYEIIKLQNNLALVLQRLGQYQPAKILQQKALASVEIMFGKEHANTAACYSNLGLTLNSLGEYKEAKTLMIKAMLSDEKSFGTNHPTTNIRCANLAIIYRALKEYDKAEPLLEKVLQLNIRDFGEDHPRTAMNYNNLAIVYNQQGKYRKAKELLEKSVSSNEKHLSDNHPNTATSYSLLASTLTHLGEYKRARILFNKAILSDEKNFGKDHHVTARRYLNLASLLVNLKEFNEALDLTSKACAIFMKTYPPEHPERMTANQNLQNIKQMMKAK